MNFSVCLQQKTIAFRILSFFLVIWPGRACQLRLLLASEWPPREFMLMRLQRQILVRVYEAVMHVVEAIQSPLGTIRIGQSLSWNH